MIINFFFLISEYLLLTNNLKISQIDDNLFDF